MKLNNQHNTECDIKLIILKASNVIAWDTRVTRAMKPLNDKPDVSYTVKTEGKDIVIRLWLDDEVQQNKQKLAFILDIFHNIDVEFTPVHCISNTYFKDLTRIISEIKRKQFDKENAIANRKLLKKNFCNCAKLISTALLYFPMWAIHKLS